MSANNSKGKMQVFISKNMNNINVFVLKPEDKLSGFVKSMILSINIANKKFVIVDIRAAPICNPF
jgi:hypothetical protein